jgi:hypothetical protein
MGILDYLFSDENDNDWQQHLPKQDSNGLVENKHVEQLNRELEPGETVRFSFKTDQCGSGSGWEHGDVFSMTKSYVVLTDDHLLLRPKSWVIDSPSLRLPLVMIKDITVTQSDTITSNVVNIQTANSPDPSARNPEGLDKNFWMYTGTDDKATGRIVAAIEDFAARAQARQMTKPVSNEDAESSGVDISSKDADDIDKIEERLEKVQELFEQGAISEKEHEQRRKEILEEI